VYGRKELFRKAALERLASPERLDKLVTLARPRRRAALAGGAVVIGLVILWFVAAMVP
jgi:HlyD family secretion protein